MRIHYAIVTQMLLLLILQTSLSKLKVHTVSPIVGMCFELCYDNLLAQTSNSCFSSHPIIRRYTTLIVNGFVK
jgi:hypothetical protein